LESYLSLSRLFLVSFLDSVGNEEFFEGCMKLVFFHIQNHCKLFSDGKDGYYDEWISDNITLTVTSLLDAKSSEDSATSVGRRLFLLLSIERSLSSCFNSVPAQHLHQFEECADCCVISCFPFEIVENIVRYLPLASLLTSSSREVVLQTKRVLSLATRYQRSVSEDLKNGNVNDINSGGLSSCFQLISCIMETIISEKVDAVNEENILFLNQILTSFQGNQQLSTMILGKILVLLQQYSHYFSSAKEKHHTKGNSQRLAPSLSWNVLRKAFHLLTAERKLFCLLQLQLITSSTVKNYLLSCFSAVSSSLPSLVEELRNSGQQRSNDSNSSSVFSDISFLFQFLNLVVMEMSSYATFFLANDFSSDNHLQIFVGSLTKIDCIFSYLLDSNFDDCYPLSGYAYFQRIISPFIRTMEEAVKKFPRSSFAKDIKGLMNKRKTQLHDWVEKYQENDNRVKLSLFFACSKPSEDLGCINFYSCSTEL
jgi:hypothetical protein